MKKKSITSLICILLISLSSHAQWNSSKQTKGSGNVITENRTTPSYEGISISGFFDINLVAGKEGSITIVGEDNITPNIKVEVKDNILKIFTEKDKYFSSSKGKNVVITIPFESINMVSLSGSGDINSNDIIKSTDFVAKLSGSGNLKLKVDSQKIDLSLSGSGDVIVNGNTDEFITKISGSGDIDASGLKSKNANVSISGSGDTRLNCSESLYARISGSGDVEYTGNPTKKDTKVNGSGEISQG